MTMETITLNDLLVELGTLETNEERAPQRVGARLIESYFDSYNVDNKPDTEATANLLYFLTDIQVRDYALGLIDPDKSTQQVPALEYLLNEAPTDTVYVNAPAALLATIHYEIGEQTEAFLVLSNVTENYSLAQLLRRVFTSGWPTDAFASMRAELHPQVTAGIFGEDN
jgi:hypothetical protein